jgi:hypothetical protein
MRNARLNAQLTSAQDEFTYVRNATVALHSQIEVLEESVTKEKKEANKIAVSLILFLNLSFHIPNNFSNFR